MGYRHKIISIISVLSVIIYISLEGVTALAQPELLTPEEWAGDVDEMAETILDNHPNPYKHVERDEFQASVTALKGRLATLTDKEITVEMAKIVALVEDGHTRLSFPRQHNELMFSFSHSTPRAPNFAALKFTALPLEFRVLGEALYIVRAEPAHAGLIGAEVLAFDATLTTDAMTAVKAVNYNDNEMTNMILTADRLTMPQVMAALGIIEDASALSLTIRPFGSEASRTITLEPAGEGGVTLTGAEASANLPGFRDRTTPKWAEAMPEAGAHYIKLNQIEGSTDYWLGDFVRDEIAKAEAAGVERLIVDIRHNHGGSGGQNRGLLNAVTASSYNQFGKLLVLTGRESFSAAQMLLNELEQYTDALFIGEASGSTPDHYGDPRRIQLANSGLVLRVSRLHWSSWRAFDDRTATLPHKSVDYTIDDYMAGRDPVLDAALSYEAPETLVALIGEVLADSEAEGGAEILATRWLTDPRAEDHDLQAFVGGLQETAAEHEERASHAAAYFIYYFLYDLGLQDVDTILAIGRNAEAMDEKVEAQRVYGMALENFPDNAEIKAKLEALGAE